MKTTAGGTGLLLMAACLAANAGGSDEMWDFTFSMKMNGSLMPTMRQQQCMTKSAAYEPAAQPNCTVSDYHASGSKASWTMTCTGEHPMTLKGEATRSGDKVDGTMTMVSEGHEMTQVVAGKIVGTCDAVEEKRKLDERLKSGKGMDAMMPPLDGAAGMQRPNMPARMPRDAADLDAARAQMPAGAQAPQAPQVPAPVQTPPAAAAQPPADQAEGSGNKLLDAAQKLKKKLGF